MIVRECDDVSGLKNLRLSHTRFARLRLIEQIIFAKKTVDTKILASRDGELDFGPFQKDISHVVLRSVNVTELPDEDAREMARSSFRDGYAQYVLCNTLRSLRHVKNVTIASPPLSQDDEQRPNGSVWMEFALRCIDDARLQLDSLAIDVKVLGQDGRLVDGWNYNPIIDFPTFSMRSCKVLSYTVRREQEPNLDDDSSGAISAGMTLAGLVETCSSSLEKLTIADYGLLIWPSESKCIEMPALRSVAIQYASLDQKSFAGWISACDSLSELRLVRAMLWTGQETSMSLTDWKTIFDAIAYHRSKMMLVFDEVDILVGDDVNVDLKMYTGAMDKTEHWRPEHMEAVVKYLAGCGSWADVL